MRMTKCVASIFVIQSHALRPKDPTLPQGVRVIRFLKHCLYLSLGSLRVSCEIVMLGLVMLTFNLFSFLSWMVVSRSNVSQGAHHVHTFEERCSTRSLSEFAKRELYNCEVDGTPTGTD